MRFWRIAVFAWIGIIFFSSTSTASEWSENAFTAISSLLFSGLSRESTSFSLVHLLADKGLHVAMFAILAVLLDRALLGSNRKFAIIVGIGFLVGCCSEYLQSFFPGRDPAITDVIINTFGTALGAAFGLLLEQLRVPRFRERSNARPLE